MNRQNVHIILFSTVLLLLPQSSPAEPLPSPDILQAEKSTYTGVFEGNSGRSDNDTSVEPGYSLEITTIPMKENGTRSFRYHELKKDNEGNQFERAILFRDDSGKLVTSSQHDVVREKTGRIVRDCRLEIENEAVPLRGDAYPSHISFYMRGIPFRVGHRTDYYCRMSDSQTFKVYVKVVDEERIDVPAGIFDCYRVKCWPDIETYLNLNLGRVLVKLAEPLTPKWESWFAKKPPHCLVRSRGPSGSSGSPVVTQELTSFRILTDNAGLQ